MHIIGITGAIGHGKSTIAKILCDIEPSAEIFETSEVICEVANKLCTTFDEFMPDLNNPKSIQSWLEQMPKILSSILNQTIPPDAFKISSENFSSNAPEFVKLWEFIDSVHQNPAKALTPITQGNKHEYRALLQWIGGFCVENIDSVIWNTELLRRAEIARENSSILAILGGIRFKEEAELTQLHGGLIIEVVRPNNKEQDILDPTERKRKLINADCTIMNDGTIEILNIKVLSLYNDVLHGKLKSHY